MNRTKLLIIILAMAIVVLIVTLILSSNIKPVQMMGNAQIKCETPSETTPTTPCPTTKPTPKPTCTPNPKPPMGKIPIVCICLIWIAISFIAFILGILLCACIHKLYRKRHGRY